MSVFWSLDHRADNDLRAASANVRSGDFFGDLYSPREGKEGSESIPHSLVSPWTVHPHAVCLQLCPDLPRGVSFVFFSFLVFVFFTCT